MLRFPLPCLILIAALWPHCAAHAQDRPTPAWTLITGNFVTHYRFDPEHNNRPRMIGLEYHPTSDWLVGGANFVNSFSQRSTYAYVGRRFESREGRVYAKLTGGLLHGYRGEYRDRIPLNQLGVAPAVVPAFGVRYARYSGEVVVLGTSALSLHLGYSF